MQHTQPPPHALGNFPGVAEPSASAVSWSAVIAGAVIAASVSAMLITGGSGFGFLFLSPWHHESLSGASLAVASIVWMLLTQIIAYAIGGYVAGRLRTKWTDAEVDEIYFRDTAHGFLVWALSALAGLVLLGAMAASIVSGTVRAGAVLAGVSTSSPSLNPSPQEPVLNLEYFTDMLLRTDGPAAPRAQSGTQPEVHRMLAHSLANGRIPDADRPYLTRLIAQQARVDDAVAEERISYVEELARQAEYRGREAADAARKAAVSFSLWAFASLLIGAFVASFAATIGGRARDNRPDAELDDDMERYPADNATAV